MILYIKFEISELCAVTFMAYKHMEKVKKGTGFSDSAKIRKFDTAALKRLTKSFFLGK